MEEPSLTFSANIGIRTAILAANHSSLAAEFQALSTTNGGKRFKIGCTALRTALWFVDPAIAAPVSLSDGVWLPYALTDRGRPEASHRDHGSESASPADHEHQLKGVI